MLINGFFSKQQTIRSMNQEHPITSVVLLPVLLQSLESFLFWMKWGWDKANHRWGSWIQFSIFYNRARVYSPILFRFVHFWVNLCSFDSPPPLWMMKINMFSFQLYFFFPFHILLCWFRATMHIHHALDSRLSSAGTPWLASEQYASLLSLFHFIHWISSNNSTPFLWWHQPFYPALYSALVDEKEWINYDHEKHE